MVAFPVAIACMIGMFVVSVGLTRQVQLFFAPLDAFFCTPTPISRTILIVAIFALVIPTGLLIANLLLWLIPAARHAFDRAETRIGKSFSTANAGLIKLFFAMAGIFLPIYFLAIGSMVCISQANIYYRQQLLTKWYSYPISQVEAVRPMCRKGSRGGWDIGLIVTIADNSSFDLAAVEFLVLFIVPTNPKFVKGPAMEQLWDRGGLFRGAEEPSRSSGPMKARHLWE